MPQLFRLRLAILFGIVAVCLSTAVPGAEEQYVTWTTVVNATVTESTLQKTSGGDGWEDAGAASTQELSAGDGYVEFTVGEDNTMWLGGLSQGDASVDWREIDFAFRFNGAGWADVIENGAYQPGGDTPYAAGDRFRVAVINGRVQYFRNGQFLTESAATPQYPLLLDVSLLSLGATVNDAVLGIFPPPPPGGGFLETAGSPAVRPRFTKAQIDAFLPPGDAAGAFRFPAPYNTDAVRLTDASLCAGGQDCLWYVGYSYWRNINNHVGSADMYIFVGTDPARGGSGPILLRYNKPLDVVQNLGPLFAEGDSYWYSTGEGWYFSASKPTRLYTTLVGSGLLRRYDVLLRQFETVPAMNLAACARPRICPSDAAYITQAHSSDDDIVHSATVQNASWQRIGCVTYEADDRRFRYFAPPSGFAIDECHVDKSGRWLVILETRADGSRQNRVVNLGNGRIRTIRDVDGALGHLDMGFGYAIGADTFNPLPNATIRLDFPVASTQRPIGPVVHYNKRWDIAAANHIAHGNAAAAGTGRPYACGSNASRVTDMADEIVCFFADGLTKPDGSLDVLVVGQVLTDLDAAGGNDLDGDDYEQTPKGNLDVTGSYFLWTTNLGSGRLDAVLVKIPAERFGVPAGTTSAATGPGRRPR
jgi:hypothetical protein